MVAIGIMCIFMVEYNPNLTWSNSFLTAKTNYSKQIYFATIRKKAMKAEQAAPSGTAITFPSDSVGDTGRV
jgi:hypothetical protein